MSIKAMSRVWDESPRKGSALLLLLAIADFANENGEAWPSVDTLANKCRMSRRNVQTLATSLATDGDITIQENGGPRGCNIYRLAKVGGANIAPAQSGDASAKKRGANQRRQTAQEPSGAASDPAGTPAPAGAGRSASVHNQFIDEWCECYKAQFGTNYVVMGGADGKATRQLLTGAKLPASDLIKVALAAWAKHGKEFWTCENKSRTIRDFAANWNRILAELERPAPGQISAAPVIERITKQPPAGLKPFSKQPPPGFDEKMEKITMDEWKKLYPLTSYYDDRTLEPLG